MKNDDYERFYDEDSPDYWAHIGQFESDEPEEDEDLENFTIDDIKNVKTFPCPRCGAHTPNDDGVFMCPKCGNVFSDSEVYDLIKGY